MPSPVRQSSERFQFRLLELFILTAACAVFFALVRYQFTPGLAVFFEVATIVVIVRRVPYRFNFAVVFGSAALTTWGIATCQLAEYLSPTGISLLLTNLGTLMIVVGAPLFIGSASFLAFLIWVITSAVEVDEDSTIVPVQRQDQRERGPQ